MMKCSTCGTRISTGWLVLALPWSKYICARCGSVFAGTLLRTFSTTILVGVLGYIVIQVIKGKMSVVFLVPLVALALLLFLGNLPKQIKRIGEVGSSSDKKPG